jgi:helix-turn-helix protein
VSAAADVPRQRAYSPAQFGEMTTLPETTVRQLIRGGEIYARKAGRRWIIPDWVLEDYLKRPDTA